MTQPVQEPSAQRADANLSWGERQLRRRPSPIAGSSAVVLFIKVFGDSQTVRAANALFVFAISEDMDGMSLSKVETYITTVSSSGKVTMQVENNTTSNDMLSTPAEIDVGELDSADAATQPVINPAFAQVSWKDHLAINVPIAGTGARGLGTMLTFVP